MKHIFLYYNVNTEQLSAINFYGEERKNVHLERQLERLMYQREKLVWFVVYDKDRCFWYTGDGECHFFTDYYSYIGSAYQEYHDIVVRGLDLVNGCKSPRKGKVNGKGGTISCLSEQDKCDLQSYYTIAKPYLKAGKSNFRLIKGI